MCGPSELAVVSGRLRVVFDRSDERWGHRVEWCGEDGRFTPLLQSLEGSRGEESLPSPPMQDVTMQRLADGVDVALGIGMAGRNHWSIAFTPACGAYGRPEDNWLAFALASRLREDVAELRSSYRLIAPAQQVSVEPRTVEIAFPEVRLRVHSEAELSAIEGGFSIVVRPPSPQKPFTQKWSYAIDGEPVNDV